MKGTREFEIAWQGLRLGAHEYAYQLTDDFLKRYNYEGEESLNNLNVQVQVNFEKHSSFFMMKFEVNGTVDVMCDRCGDDMSLKIWEEYNLLIKLVEEGHLPEETEEDDVVFIPKNETVIDIGKWIYEYLMLSIPLQKVHGSDGEGKSLCNPDALNLLSKMNDQHQNEEKSIWQGLKNLNIDKKKK